MPNKFLVSTMIGCTALLSLPQITFAASTPQQLIDRLAQNKTLTAQTIDGTFDVSVKERAVVKGTKLNEASLSLRLSQRVLPRGNSTTTFDTEGRLSLEKIAFTELPFPLTQPLSIQWKYVQDKAFFRIETLPDALVNYMRGQEVDLLPYIGHWFELDQEIMDGIKSLQVKTAGLSQNDLQVIAKQRAFQAVRVEQRVKDANGDSIVRIRAKLSAAFINSLLQAELKKLDRKSSTYRTDYQQIVTQHQKIAKVLKAMTFILGVNETKNELTRLELGGSVTEPRKSCTYNYTTNKNVCRTVAQTTIQINGGFSLKKDIGAPIEMPYSSMKFFEFIGNLM